MSRLFRNLLCFSLLCIGSSYAEEPANKSAEEPAKSQEIETTLAIIKPDAVQANHIGEIIARYEKEGIRVAAVKMGTLSKEEAAEFYRQHKGRPFFDDLVTYMSSGPIVILALQGKGSILKNREIMGATDPSKADKGTLRQVFGQSISKNAVHGSDSSDSAKDEILFFFEPDEVAKRF